MNQFEIERATSTATRDASTCSASYDFAWAVLSSASWALVWGAAMASISEADEEEAK